ncbi:alpha-N-acetylglucosaminidase TIM-barrel domain-containing protein [Pseudactinotalea sp. Z1739]|uniref:alpha-N-acetylglucosaminidase n=1 Tax=Pseudactinotalea sp. Z1739 TaxID=3413028 RepID=UPI003C7C0C14
MNNATSLPSAGGSEEPDDDGTAVSGDAGPRSGPGWAPALSALAERVLGAIGTRVTFGALPGQGRAYAYRAQGNRLWVDATDAASAAVGLHEYLREQCRIAVSWDDLRPPPPAHLPDALRTEGAARVAETYYLNFCTFGYTSPWWDWEQWEREIDWMALRGITAPLMMVGHEAVVEQVLLDDGVPAETVQKFLAGPAYLPWFAMGALEGHAGPLPQGWIGAHRDLAGKILTRQRELGMRPVLPAFTGHVPAELAGDAGPAALTTAADSVDSAGARDWQGHRTHVVGPEDPTFRRLAAATVRTQQKFWGTDHRYAADPFIEMIPVQDDPGYPGRVAAALLAGLTDADPEATWFLQTWPFSYQEHFWTAERVRAFLGDIDAGRLVLLDLWAEAQPQWRRFDGFGGRDWMWCALLNFGGRNEPLADLPGVTEELEAALAASHPPMGAGLSMEATGSVPVFFERVLDATWRPPAPLTEWLGDWAAQRYRLPPGEAAERAGAAWDGLARTVLGAGGYRIFPEAFTGLLTMRPPVNPFETTLARPSQAAPTTPDTPGTSGTQASPSTPEAPGPLAAEVRALLWYEPDTLIRAWTTLVELAEEHPHLASGPLGADLVETAVGVLARCGELTFLAAFDPAGGCDDEAAERFLTVFDDLDALLATRPEYRYDHWEAQALRWATSDEDARVLADNARRLVTVWGQVGDGYLDDYSARYWSGLVGYYGRRWREWARWHPIGSAEEWEARLQQMEADFLSEGPAAPPAHDSVTVVSRRLLDTYGPLFINTARALREQDMPDDDGAPR